MKTNFTQQRFLVLTNEDDKVMAIINCLTGKNDISEKLLTAIEEDYDATEVVINAVIINGIETLNAIEEHDFNIEFKADISCAGFDTDTEIFTLKRTEVY